MTAGSSGLAGQNGAVIELALTRQRAASADPDVIEPSVFEFAGDRYSRP